LRVKNWNWNSTTRGTMSRKFWLLTCKMRSPISVILIGQNKNCGRNHQRVYLFPSSSPSTIAVRPPDRTIHLRSHCNRQKMQQTRWSNKTRSCNSARSCNPSIRPSIHPSIHPSILILLCDLALLHDDWGVYLRSRKFHYYNHRFPLLMIVM